MNHAEKQTNLCGKQVRVCFLDKKRCMKTDAKGKTY